MIFFFPCAHIFKAEENGVLWIICFAHRQRAGMASIAFNCLFLAPRSQTVIGKLFSLKKKKNLALKVVHLSVFDVRQWKGLIRLL